MFPAYFNKKLFKNTRNTHRIHFQMATIVSFSVVKKAVATVHGKRFSFFFEPNQTKRKAFSMKPELANFKSKP